MFSSDQETHSSLTQIFCIKCMPCATKNTVYVYLSCLKASYVRELLMNVLNSEIFPRTIGIK